MESKTPLSDKDAGSAASSDKNRAGREEENREGEEGRGRGGDEEPGAEDGRASEALEKELESLKEKIRSMEKEGIEASKFVCLVCQVSLPLVWTKKGFIIMTTQSLDWAFYATETVSILL